ncbi:SAM-dependent methyltransferase TehB [Acinetobacter sp.]|uniref:SAM-dependent methyltransferase TehB n=1 Tax=Acinetobacter sp. TaxID=472 RepID=UPI0031DB136F
MKQLLCYKQLPVWNLSSIPEGFKDQHNTKKGTWAKLTILSGHLDFAMLDEQGNTLSEHHFSVEHQPPFIEPQAWHKIVAASADIQCQLSFYCEKDAYFSKKYQLTETHSEILAALPQLKGGQALDVGCGTGRNTLFLSQNGFDLDAWDVNPNSIQQLNEILDAEQIQNVKTQIRDLNQNPEITKSYNFICCTVVMMFLQPETIPKLIAQMQQATVSGGLNLIVCAMDTQDYPAQPFFPFAFSTGELRDYYQDWTILKYNENVGGLHRLDENGQRIKQRFATLLAKKL